MGFRCFTTTVCIRQNILSPVAILYWTCVCARALAHWGSRTRLQGVRYKEISVKCSAFY